MCEPIRLQEILYPVLVMTRTAGAQYVAAIGAKIVPLLIRPLHFVSLRFGSLHFKIFFF